MADYITIQRTKNVQLHRTRKLVLYIGFFACVFLFIPILLCEHMIVMCTHTVKKGGNFLIYKEIQMGFGAKSSMTNGFFISD
jgi:hypothetical protein